MTSFEKRTAALLLATGVIIAIGNSRLTPSLTPSAAKEQASQAWNTRWNQPGKAGLVIWHDPQNPTALGSIVIHYPDKTVNLSEIRADASAGDIAEGETVYVSVPERAYDKSSSNPNDYVVVHGKREWEHALATWYNTSRP